MLNVSDSGISQTLAPCNASDYLTSLGLAYDQSLQRQPDDRGPTRVIGDTSKLYLIATDILVVIRTDKAAGGGGGGAAGLPSELRSNRGAMVIVDDADTVAALANPGGPWLQVSSIRPGCRRSCLRCSRDLGAG